MSQLSWNDLETKTLRHEQQIAQLNAALEMMRQLTLQTGVVVNSVVPIEVIAKKELDHLRSKAKAGGEAMDAIDAVLRGPNAMVPGLYIEGMLKTDAIKLLGAKYNELHTEVNALHVDLARTSGALAATNTDLNNAKSHVERLQKELANANDALDASADRARARMNELESARGQINMLNNDRLELAGRLKTVNDARDGLTRLFEDATKVADSEKRHRIYYQDMVYAICNVLDNVFGDKTVVGSAAIPSTHACDRVKCIVEKNADLKRELERTRDDRNGWQSVVNRAEREVCGHCTVAPPSGSMLVEKVIELKSKLQVATHALESANELVRNQHQEIVELKAESNARNAMQ